MKKPMVGIVPLVDMERESYWMLPGYMKGLEKEDAIPVMLPLTSDWKTLKQLAEQLDGFLFTGCLPFDLWGRGFEDLRRML